MDIKLLLKGNAAYSWKSDQGVYFIGYFFDEEGVLYRGNEALSVVKNEIKAGKTEEYLAKCSGNFTVLSISENQCQIISDGVNYFPIFYAQTEDLLILSDSWEEMLHSLKNTELNTDSFPEFETAGFVLGEETLAKNIFKNNAGQILQFSNGTKTVKQYIRFGSGGISEASFDELFLQAETLQLKVGKRMIDFLDGRTAIVPLSGGYDSRLIVALLRKYNYKKVICFTYGKNNPEVPVSKKVAETLGFEWYFVDFSKIDIESIEKTDFYSNYLQYAGNGFSMPYLMEFFALSELKKRGIIPDNSVVFPGHSGDFLGGSYILKTVKNTLPISKLPKLIESKYFNFIKKDFRTKKQLRKRIAKSLEFAKSSEILQGYNRTVEQWDVQEKLSKFIFHSTHAFTYFGIEHYFPLWDRTLVNFYSSLPYQFRENKKLYDKVAVEKFFMPLHIYFDEQEIKISGFARNFQKIKDSVRYFFPWKMVLKRVDMADWPYYQRLSGSMKKFVEKKRNRKFKDFKTYNAVICAWYIEMLKSKLKNGEPEGFQKSAK